MFDIGFSEMLVLAVVALVVLGPERLPKVARQTGQWVGALRRYVDDMKADLSRQMHASDLQALQVQMQEAAREFRSEMHGLTQSVAEVAPDPAVPTTDWVHVHAVRRQREKIMARRAERVRALGRRSPRRAVSR